MQEVCNLVATKLEVLLPKPEGLLEDDLFEGIRYATLSAGKRIRPFLTIQTAKLLGVAEENALNAAIAIEMIHTYSLVHDDLPAMDNDDLRRGQPTCHKKFGEATAILVGDALLTYAFELASDPITHPDPEVRATLVNAMAKTAGFAGMVGGQIIDMHPGISKATFPEIVRLQRMKTGALFVMSCDAGAILAKAQPQTRSALRAYANNLGLAFQIMDDLEDQIADSEAPHVEAKATLVTYLGHQKAHEHAKLLANQAIEHLVNFDNRAALLRELALYIVRGWLWELIKSIIVIWAPSPI